MGLLHYITTTSFCRWVKAILYAFPMGCHGDLRLLSTVTVKTTPTISKVSPLKKINFTHQDLMHASIIFKQAQLVWTKDLLRLWSTRPQCNRWKGGHGGETLSSTCTVHSETSSISWRCRCGFLNVVEALQQNKPDIPSLMKASKIRDIYSTDCGFSGNLTIVRKKWKAVVLQSMTHHNKEVEENRANQKWSQPITRPKEV